MIAFAVVGPTPGSSWSSFAPARLISILCVGGFFAAEAEAAAARINAASRTIHASADPSFIGQTCEEHTTRKSIQLVSLRVLRRDWAEQCGLFGDLRAIADDHDLRVRRIEVAAGGCEDVGRGQRADSFAVRF